MQKQVKLRIGPKMALAAQIVATMPGCAIKPVAERVGPHGSTHRGYQIVHRAICAGLIRATKVNGRYSLNVA